MKRSAFTLIELLVVIAIIAILAAILFPVFARARQSAYRIACVSNMNQIGKAIMMYVQDYNYTYPYGRWKVDEPIPDSTKVWPYWVDRYIKDKEVHLCPAKSRPTKYGDTWGTRGMLSIGYNIGFAAWYYLPSTPIITKEKSLKRLTNVVVLCDSYPGPTIENFVGYEVDNLAVNLPKDGGGNRVFAMSDRHNQNVNIYHCDGHVKGYRIERVMPRAGARAPQGCVGEAYRDMNDAELKWLVWDHCFD
jgi:prepilin-type N-terminal cleavage/methylation domain-containing protein/prepilin-type processing-associated H-X9-DG protein